MADLIRNHPALLFAIILAWVTYGAFDTEPPKAKGGEKPGEIEAVMLATRSASARPTKVRSPFAPWLEPPEPGRSSALPQPGQWLIDPIASARDTITATHEELGPLHLLAGLLQRSVFPGLGSADDLLATLEELARVRLPREAMRPSFTLTLEAVLGLPGGGGRARISGRDVQVGDEIPGVDPVSPPRLVGVSGQRALIDHRSEQFVLDLGLSPSASFGPTLPDG